MGSMKFRGGEIVRFTREAVRAGKTEARCVVLSPFYAELINERFETPGWLQVVDLVEGQAWSARPRDVYRVSRCGEASRNTERGERC